MKSYLMKVMIKAHAAGGGRHRLGSTLSRRRQRERGRRPYQLRGPTSTSPSSVPSTRRCRPRPGSRTERSAGLLGHARYDEATTEAPGSPPESTARRSKRLTEKRALAPGPPPGTEQEGGRRDRARRRLFTQYDWDRPERRDRMIPEGEPRPPLEGAGRVFVRRRMRRPQRSRM